MDAMKDKIIKDLHDAALAAYAAGVIPGGLLFEIGAATFTLPVPSKNSEQVCATFHATEENPAPGVTLKDYVHAADQGVPKFVFIDGIFVGMVGLIRGAITPRDDDPAFPLPMVGNRYPVPSTVVSKLVTFRDEVRKRRAAVFADDGKPAGSC